MAKKRIAVTVVPRGQFDEAFIEGMRARMIFGYMRYGDVKEHYEKMSPGTAILDALARVKKYKKTGNTEWLMDAANFIMVEFMHPSHPKAHFVATCDTESPGVVGLHPREVEALDEENKL